MSASAYSPLGERIIVRRDDLGRLSPGGLHIPAQAQEHGRLATVIAVGPGRITSMGALVPPTVQPGDRVLTHKARAGRVLENEGKDGEIAVLESEAEILCVVGEGEGPERYRLLSDRVMVRRDPLQREVGGVLVPDVAQRHGRTATVVAVGPGAHDEIGTLRMPVLKVGQRVLTYHHKGLALEAEGQDGELAVMRESDVMCVVGEAASEAAGEQG